MRLKQRDSLVWLGPQSAQSETLASTLTSATCIRGLVRASLLPCRGAAVTEILFSHLAYRLNWWGIQSQYVVWSLCLNLRKWGLAHLQSKTYSMSHHRRLIWLYSQQQQTIASRRSNRRPNGCACRVPRIVTSICFRIKWLQYHRMDAKVSDWGLSHQNLPRYASAAAVNKPNKTLNANHRIVNNYITVTQMMILTPTIRIIH